MVEVLYEDNHLLVVNKPAGLPTMGVDDKPCLLEVAKDYVRRKYDKPGNVYLGTVSRLDAPVTGVIVFARTSKAAARVAKQFRDRRVDKTYWAIVGGSATEQSVECVDWLRKDERHRRMHTCQPEAPGAQEAILRYRAIQSLDEKTLVEIQLETGRKHQIRVQLSKRGHAIVGDRKYGGEVDFPVGIALHARRLAFEHPTLGSELEFVAPLPKSWRRWISPVLEQQLAQS